MTSREANADLLAEISALRDRVAALTREKAELQGGLTQASQREAATGEILSLIASSPTDVQPVLAAVVERAARLCGANDAVIFRADGGTLTPVATCGVPAVSSVPRTRGTASGRAIVDRQPVHVEDLASPTSIAEFPDANVPRARGIRTQLAVPLLREGEAIGVILIRRFRVQPFTEQQIALLKTFADQAVIAIENVRLFTETKEALERQTATAEILRVISSSPTDLKPVLDTVAENAARVCGADDAMIFRVEGDQYRRVAHYGSIPVSDSAEQLQRPMRDVVSGRAVIDGQIIHVPDIESEIDQEFGTAKLFARRVNVRTHLAVPLLREGTSIGVIVIRRREVRAFSPKQISLLETFADQAVIAIENVRLFNETKEALEQQTATSEILRVISSSPTDIEPVFGAVAESAARLCEAFDAAIFRRDGDSLRLAAHHGPIAIQTTLPLIRGTSNGRAVLEGRTVHVADMQNETEEFPEGSENARRMGHRTVLAVPLMREGIAIGTIIVRRTEAHLFTERQVALLQTFADQAVIAIENVRLFTELQASNRDLTTALEQQTATSELLKVIGRSTFDLQPVFETLAENAVRLCEAERAFIFRFDGEVLRVAATHNVSAARRDFAEQHPIRPGRHSAGARAALERRTIHIQDIQADSEYTYQVGQADPAPTRTVLSVPILRVDELLGVITIFRHEVRPFSESQIALMETFADQAVIAIENVRLFTELQEKNQALTEAHARVTESLEQQTATSEILRVISRSPTDTQPVFDAIARNAVALCGGIAALVLRYDGEMLHIAGHHEMSPDAVERVERAFPRRPGRDYPPGRALLERHVVHIPDLQAATEFTASTARQRGVGSMLVVPLLREGEAIGVISLARDVVGSFSVQQIEVLQIFADQAVIAIENVRLFKELEARTTDLTRSVEQLTALGEVGRAVSSTLDLETVLTTIVGRAVELSGTSGGVIYEHDEATGEFRLRANHQLETVLVELLREAPFRLGEGVTGRAAALRTPTQVRDILAEREFALARVSPIAERLGYRSILAVPLLLEDRVMGGLTVWRKQPGDFAPEVVQLLQTFAAQSSLALQNARLFREIADKSRQLEVASQHKSEFLANMSHELRTPLNAIIGFSEVLSEKMFGELNEKQEEYLKDIYASGTHLLSLINDILDLSKIEAGRMELELTAFHLPMALDSALTLVRERAGRRGISLYMNVDNRLGQIRADERKVRQVVLNLLSNAIKFTPEGGRIEVRATPQDGLIEISVSDTGVGIAPEDQDAIFEEFRQVGTADTKAEGTGLGLTLCRKFIELHGGRIWVKSQLGAGSTFTFTIPVRRGE